MISLIIRFKHWWFLAISTYKAGKTHPSDINLDLSDMLNIAGSIKIAVIDNDGFPWKDACEDRGYQVSIYDDFFKSYRKKKSKAIDISEFDIILVDLNDVGSDVYPTMQGIGVIEKIREENPFKIIVAYTGDPGQILKRNKGHLVEAIFSKEWDDDDVLTNLGKIRDILFKPKERWDFIEHRLRHAGASDEQVKKVRFTFVKMAYFFKLLKKNEKFKSEDYMRLIKNAETSLIDESMVHLGTTSIAIAKLAFPIWGKLNGN